MAKLRPGVQRMMLASCCSVAVSLLAFVAAASPAAAQTNPEPGAGSLATETDAYLGDGIDVVQLEGLLDPPNVDLVESTIAAAEKRGSTLVVFQLDSGGAIDTDVEALVDVVRSATVPVAVWVGPSGAGAKGAATELALAAPWAVISQGSGIGPAHPSRPDEPDLRTEAQTEATLAELLEATGRSTDGATRLVTERSNAEEALDVGLVDDVQPTVGDVIVALDGETIVTASGPVTLSTAEVVQTDAGPRRQPNQDVRFHKLSLVGQARHTLATPWVAYFLFVAGLALIVFEFYTASVGIAGAAGALALVGAFTGFAHLPVEWWAVALLVFGIFGFTVDVQAGRVGPWTAIGGVSLVAGSIFLYGGSSSLDPAWWVVAAVVVATGLFMLGAMPSMLRARFSTPTVGREAMIGEMGTAEVAVDPDGVVRVRDALWRARTNRATPIDAGDRVRVVAVEGIVLEVEPEAGGARDYRDRSR